MKKEFSVGAPLVIAMNHENILPLDGPCHRQHFYVICKINCSSFSDVLHTQKTTPSRQLNYFGILKTISTRAIQRLHVFEHLVPMGVDTVVIQSITDFFL